MRYDDQIIGLLRDSGRPMSIREMAIAIGTTPHHIRSAVMSLERFGMIRREPTFDAALGKDVARFEVVA